MESQRSAIRTFRTRSYAAGSLTRAAQSSSTAVAVEKNPCLAVIVVLIVVLVVVVVIVVLPVANFGRSLYEPLVLPTLYFIAESGRRMLGLINPSA